MPIGPISGLGFVPANSSSANSSSRGTAIDWNALISGISDQGMNLLQGRYGTPQGMYTRYDPNTGRPVVVYNSPQGSTTPVFGATDLGASASLSSQGQASGLSNSTLLIIGGVALLAIFLMNRSGR